MSLPAWFALTPWPTLVAALLALIGAILLTIALRPRLRGSAPHCRRCQYNLTGLDDLPNRRCPECGTGLASKRAVQIGAGRRRRWAIVAALAVLLLGATPLVVGFRQIVKANWYAFAPTLVVLADMESGDTVRIMRALGELPGRGARGRLSDAQLQRVIQYGLRSQDTSKSMSQLLTMTDMCLSSYAYNHLLSKAQSKQFYDGMVRVSANAPAETPAGQPCTIECEANCLLPYYLGGTLRIAYRFDDEDPVQEQSAVRNYPSPPTPQAFQAGLALDAEFAPRGQPWLEAIPADGRIPARLTVHIPESPGPHRIKVIFDVQLFVGDTAQVLASKAAPTLVNVIRKEVAVQTVVVPSAAFSPSFTEFNPATPPGATGFPTSRP